MLGLKIVKHLYIGHLSVKLLGLCKNHRIYTPPQLRSPLPFDGRGAGYHCCLTWLPTPRRKDSGRSFDSPPLVGKNSGRSFSSPPLVGKNSGRSFSSPLLVGKNSSRSFDSPPLVGAGSWQGGRGARLLPPNNLFPCWELNIPTLGTVIINPLCWLIRFC